ncbi:hypothetical protein [Frigoribacterium sp. Leaf263]|nr:hypothetical protein [Frigoribacterium sp. Leaf263]
MNAQMLQSLTHEQLVAVVRGTVSVGALHNADHARELSQTAA